MKYLVLIVIALALITNSLQAQVADGISYQAVALDELGKEIPGHDINGMLIFNNKLALGFSILKGKQDGEILYHEIHSTYSDQYGLVSLVIGHGDVQPDGKYKKLNDINWGADKLFLKVEIDIHGTGSFKVMGIQQMMAVPFAFYALSSSGNTVVNYDNILNKPLLATVATTGNYTDLLNKPSFFDGDYNSLSNKPVIPQKLSSLVNDAGYITSFTETDPVWNAVSSNYYTKSNLQTINGAQVHFGNITNKPSSLAAYGITDAMNISHVANSITGPDISNWNAAFSWGNHSGLYRPINYVPSWPEISSKPFSLSAPQNNQIIRYNSGSGLWENWTPDYLTGVREAADEFTASAGQTSFLLSQIPASGSRVKMYINGVRISNGAYSISGNTVTYASLNNGSFVLEAGDRIQFDYSY